jgi:hypothetical protein
MLQPGRNGGWIREKPRFFTSKPAAFFLSKYIASCYYQLLLRPLDKTYDRNAENSLRPH